MTNKELLAQARILMVKANEYMGLAARVRSAALKAHPGFKQAMLYRGDELRDKAKKLRKESLGYQRQITREGASRS